MLLRRDDKLQSGLKSNERHLAKTETRAPGSNFMRIYRIDLKGYLIFDIKEMFRL